MTPIPSTLDAFLAEVDAIIQSEKRKTPPLSPALQATRATALHHWYGDAQGTGARTFRGVPRETVQQVRQRDEVRQAEAYVETVARTGSVAATEAACQALTLVYKRALRQTQEAVAA